MVLAEITSGDALKKIRFYAKIELFLTAGNGEMDEII